MTQTNIYTDTFLDSGIVKLGILQNIIHYLALKKISNFSEKKHHKGGDEVFSKYNTSRNFN